METFVIAIHVIAAVAIVGLILLQQGKGAEAGAAFGSGSSQTIFGPQGTGTVFSTWTAILTAIFFVTSFWLAILAKDKVSGKVEAGVPAAQVQQQDVPKPVESDIPATAPANNSGDIPKK